MKTIGKRLLTAVAGTLMSITLLQGQIDNTQTITKSGTTIAQFLKIGVDPRGSAMGNAFAAMYGDVGAIFWNPAGLAGVRGIEAMFMNSQWLTATDFNFLAVAVHSPGIGVLGLSVTNLAVPDDKVRTVAEPEGTGELWDANDLALTFTYARQLTDKFLMGGNIKYIRQNIWHASASGFAVDLGTLFVTPFNNIRLAAVLSNYGTDMHLTGRDLKISVDPDPVNEGNAEFVNADYETDTFPLPLMFRVGLAGEFLQTSFLRASFGVDALQPNDNTEAVNAGVELAIRESFFLRGGYSSLFREDSEEGLTLGGGIHYRLWRSTTILKLDYSYAYFGRFPDVQRVAMRIRF